MKKIILLFVTIAICLSTTERLYAQEQEIQQLILNVEKLKQLKSILNQMYKGYQILSNGYNTVRDLSQGNFNLHKVFLDKLLEVSPVVRQYRRVVDVIDAQRTLVKEYKSAISQFEQLDVFNKNDVLYLRRVYGNLFERSLKNLDELLMVITANELRMNDAERLNAIDRIYDDMQDKLQFLRHFNAKARLLAAQRKQELNDLKTLQKVYGIGN